MPFKSEKELESIKKELRTTAWPLVYGSSVKWELKAGTDKAKGGLVYKGSVPKIGTVWKIEVIVDISPDEYYERFIRRSELVGWVPHLVEWKVIEMGEKDGEMWKVTYSDIEGMATISPRDFCSLNFYDRLSDGSYSSMTIATKHPDYPKQDGRVRGEYLPTAAWIKPVEGYPNKCELVWSNNNDMKGMLPRALINLVQSGFLLEFGEACIKHCAELSKENGQ